MVLSCIGLLSILNIFLINNSTQSAWLRKYYIIQHLFFLHERKRCPDQKSNPGNLIYKVNNLPIMFSRSTIRPALFHSDNFNNLLYRVHSSTEKAIENWNTNNNWRINIKKRKKIIKTEIINSNWVKKMPGSGGDSRNFSLQGQYFLFLWLILLS